VKTTWFQAFAFTEWVQLVRRYVTAGTRPTKNQIRAMEKGTEVGLALTPGWQIGYMDHTGCHQLVSDCHQLVF
jgi:hypothetical protein